ncbi:hypothetical protein AVEN_136269-1 [Araneus ventricosus]|uniref:Uncharacterized protein n=1 Tax=Araneus ventricosus TaxID=182803 RepID=A0A4Y2L6D8_ARAVE|nr:hypothetical protein AVEN_136269-1 [Araneus ventricosus]
MKERGVFFHSSLSWENFSSACLAFLPTKRRSSPYPLDNVKVWRLAWSVKEGHMTAGEPVLDVLGSVLRIIILLENEATTKRIACLRTHGVLKDVFILKLFHDSLNPPQRTHAKARDVSPNHDISTPMLHFWNLVLGSRKEWLETTTPLYPIRIKQHVFAFIAAKDIFLLFLGPVLLSLRSFHTPLMIPPRDYRFPD